MDAKNGYLELLVDTGAAVSIIRADSLFGKTPLETRTKIQLTGIGTNILTTEGTSAVSLEFSGTLYTHKFQVVKSNHLMNIAAHGILGRDFLEDKVIINCIQKTFEIKEIGLAAQSNFLNSNKANSQTIGNGYSGERKSGSARPEHSSSKLVNTVKGLEPFPLSTLSEISGRIEKLKGVEDLIPTIKCSKKSIIKQKKSKEKKAAKAKAFKKTRLLKPNSPTDMSAGSSDGESVSGSEVLENEVELKNKSNLLDTCARIEGFIENKFCEVMLKSEEQVKSLINKVMSDKQKLSDEIMELFKKYESKNEIINEIMLEKQMENISDVMLKQKNYIENKVLELLLKGEQEIENMVFKIISENKVIENKIIEMFLKNKSYIEEKIGKISENKMTEIIIENRDLKNSERKKFEIILEDKQWNLSEILSEKGVENKLEKTRSRCQIDSEVNNKHIVENKDTMENNVSKKELRDNEIKSENNILGDFPKREFCEKNENFKTKSEVPYEKLLESTLTKRVSDEKTNNKHQNTNNATTKFTDKEIRKTENKVNTDAEANETFEIRLLNDTTDLETNLVNIVSQWKREADCGLPIELIEFTDPVDKTLKLGQCATILPPRSENILEINLESESELVCLAEEIESGVFIGNSIMRPIEGKSFIGVINSNSYPVNISGIKPKVDKLNKYEIYNSKILEQDDTVESRIEYLKNKLKINPELNPDERNRIFKLCSDYNDLFFVPGDKLTHTDTEILKIPLEPGTRPINRKQYRLPEAHKLEAQRQIETMLNEGIIEHSTSPFNFPVILVPKKGTDENGNRKYRLCVDFRLLNKTCVPISYPLPRIEQILDGLAKSRYFTSLDLASGFHQLLVEKEDRHKLAFSLGFGHYQYCRAPFGLKNLPYHFQALLNTVLTGLQGFKCFVYLDDVIIFAKNLDEHNDKLQEVFDRFRTHNLKLQPEKCQFLMTEIVYLGHKCSESGIQPDERLIKTIQNYPRPKTVKQIQSFLGLANYYRKFIKGFSNIAAPMNNLLKKDTKFLWTEKCEEAFENLKMALTSPPVLAFPDFDKGFDVICDASGYSLGAILEQEGRVVYYASRTLNDAERKYSATQREMLAIVWATKTFKCYLLGRHFTIYTDHQALAGCIRSTDTTSRMLRWIQKMSEFDYKIVYKPGKKNTNADCLSRIPAANETEEGCWVVTRAQLNRQTKEGANGNSENPTIVETGNQETNEIKEQNLVQDTYKQTEIKHIDNDKIDEHTSVQDASEPNLATGEKIIIEITDPKDIEIILKDNHDAILAGHFGAKRTLRKIKDKYKWTGMTKDVKNYVKRCEKCQKNKHTRGTKMPMALTGVADKPFDKVYVDIVGPLPTSECGNKYILSLMDDLTRFVDFVAMPNQEAGTVAKILFEQILSRYTLPKKLVTDQGTQFTGEMFKKLCQLLKVKKIQTTAYHPQSNHVERAHSTLGNYLRNFVDKKPASWDCYVRTAAHAFNNTVNESSGFSPMKLLFGFASEIPNNITSKPEPIYNFDDYYFELRHKLQFSFDLARKRLTEAKEKSKRYYDNSKNIRQFHIDDWVLLKNPARANKLEEIWQGPYRIIEVFPDVMNVTVVIGTRKRRVHMNRLKHYYHD